MYGYIAKYKYIAKKKGYEMRASMTIMTGSNWGEPVQVTESLSKVCNSHSETCIVNVFDSELSLREFSQKLSEVLTVPFSVKELVTKKGEAYYRVLLNPSYQNVSIDF